MQTRLCIRGLYDLMWGWVTTMHQRCQKSKNFNPNPTPKKFRKQIPTPNPNPVLALYRNYIYTQ